MAQLAIQQCLDYLGPNNKKHTETSRERGDYGLSITLLSFAGSKTLVLLLNLDWLVPNDNVQTFQPKKLVILFIIIMDVYQFIVVSLKVPEKQYPDNRQKKVFFVHNRLQHFCSDFNKNFLEIWRKILEQTAGILVIFRNLWLKLHPLEMFIILLTGYILLVALLLAPLGRLGKQPKTSLRYL